MPEELTDITQKDLENNTCAIFILDQYYLINVYLEKEEIPQQSKNFVETEIEAPLEDFVREMIREREIQPIVRVRAREEIFEWEGFKT